MINEFPDGMAPSLLAADFANLQQAMDQLDQDAVACWHIDVMDGHFVPNITIGPPVVKALKKVSNIPLDCHLMVNDPDKWIAPFSKAGADFISIHAEAAPHLHRTIQAIKASGCAAGVALNPATPIDVLSCVFEDLDYILLMSVNPGFGGQSFIPIVVKKLRELHAIKVEQGYTWKIQMDGGIGMDNLKSLVDFGLDNAVAGSAVFGSNNPAEALREMAKYWEKK